MLPYFKDQPISIISYTSTKPIATQIFNYKKALHDLNIDDVKSKRPDCPVQVPRSYIIWLATL